MLGFKYNVLQKFEASGKKRRNICVILNGDKSKRFNSIHWQ